MSDQDKSEPSGVAPAREPRREGAGQQAEAQRAQSPTQNRGDQGRGEQGRGDQSRGDQSRGERRGPRRHQRGREGQPSSYGRPEESLNMDELRELFGLFTSQGFTEFELEKEGFRVRLRRDAAPPAPPTHAQTPQAPAPSLPFVQPQHAPNAPTESAGSSPAQESPGKATAGAKEEAGTASDAQLFTLTSPIVGTFYRASSPTAEPFVKVGSHVEPESVVCIIEAMKLMNEILAEAAGVVEKIYVENGQPVEFGQPLFGIRR
jgi:acetyl-CoA carboxylase biotin carboxyl carrier protein